MLAVKITSVFKNQTQQLGERSSKQPQFQKTLLSGEKILVPLNTSVACILAIEQNEGPALTEHHQYA